MTRIPKKQNAKRRSGKPTAPPSPQVIDDSGSITVTATAEVVIAALVKRLGGRAGFTANDLARAEQLHLERRGDGHTLTLWTIGDT